MEPGAIRHTLHTGYPVCLVILIAPGSTIGDRCYCAKPLLTPGKFRPGAGLIAKIPGSGAESLIVEHMGSF